LQASFKKNHKNGFLRDLSALGGEKLLKRSTTIDIVANFFQEVL
jgi:hypothetical protein